MQIIAEKNGWKDYVFALEVFLGFFGLLIFLFGLRSRYVPVRDVICIVVK